MKFIRPQKRYYERKTVGKLRYAFIFSLMIMSGFYNAYFMVERKVGEVLGTSTTTVIETVEVPVEVEKILLEPMLVKAKTEKQSIMAYMIEVFGDDASELISIVSRCENNKFDQNATNQNRNGTIDKGVTQINSIHLSGKEFKSCIHAHDDYKSNIDCAKEIYDKYGWSAWACSHVIGINPFHHK